jgi:hypothetical protein
MRTFGVQGCNATPALSGCPRTQGLFVGCRGRRNAPDAERSVRTMHVISLPRIKSAVQHHETPCAQTYVGAPIYPRMQCNTPGGRDQGSGIGGTLRCHGITSMSPRQSTKGCGAAQRPGATGRPPGQGCGDCTVVPQPVGMRKFGVQGRSATPALTGCPRTQGLFVGVSGRPAPDA